MADENVEGTLSVGFDGKPMTEGMDKAAKEATEDAEKIAKAGEKIEQTFVDAASTAKKALGEINKALDDTAKNTQATAKKPRVGLDGMTHAERQEFYRQQREAREAKKASDKVVRESGWAASAERRRQDREQRQLAAQERSAQVQKRRETERTQREERRIERENRSIERRNREQAAREERKLQRENRAAARRERTEAERDERRQKRETLQQTRRLEREQERERRINVRETAKDTAAIQRVINRSLAAPADVQTSVLNALNGPGAQLARQSMMQVGATRQQAIVAQLGAAGLTNQSALFLAGAGGRRPPNLGGPGGGSGGPNQPGGVRGWFQRHAGSILAGAAGGLGFSAAGFGARALVDGGRALIEATEQATAYDRQRVAAENLAGSQAKLNDLLDAYAKSSGGAVDQSTELSNVTRLLATGFADSVPEVEKFVRATRGASIALGKPQDFVVQETQLAISNTSQKRLDQIGLGIDEVTERIEKLRKANANWSRETAFQQAVLGLMDEKYGDLTRTVEGQVTGVERLRIAWADLRLQMGQSAQSPVNRAAGGLSGLLEGFTLQSQYEEELRKDPNFKLPLGATDQQKRAFESAQGSEKTWQAMGYLAKAMLDLTLALKGARLTPDTGPQFKDPVRDWMYGRGGQTAPEPTLPAWRRFGEDAQAIIEASYDEEQDIIERANDARVKEVEQYEEQRANIIRDFGKQMAREEQDFFRQRARGLRDYNKSVADVGEDALEREEEMREDLDERIADAREKTAKRLTEAEEDYNEEREKAERKHRDNLLKAAGQLDAIAVLEERKRWREESKEREEAHREQLEDAREALQEQIDEAREAYEERLEDAREADRKRLEDMREAREQQLADEDEDRAIQLARAQEDHNDQLAELDRQHDLRMQQIEEESADQLKALEDALAKDLNAVGVYVEGYLEKIKDRDDAIDRWFNRVISKIEGDIAEDNAIPGGKALRDEIMGEASSRIPYAVDTNSKSGSVYTNPVITHQIGNSRTITFQEGAIQVQTTPGYEVMVGELVEEKLIELLDGVN